MTKQEAMERATVITGRCSCHEAYTSRGMIAPDCIFHDCADDIAAAILRAHNEAVEAADKAALDFAKNYRMAPSVKKQRFTQEEVEQWFRAAVRGAAEDIRALKVQP